MRPRVLMVTGAYFPEISGAGLQCRGLIQALRGHAECVVLTTSTDASLPRRAKDRRTPVHRVVVRIGHGWSEWLAALRMVGFFARRSRRFDIVQLHGFSRKSVVLIALAMIWRKHLALKLTSVGHDDPVTISRRGWLARWCYSRVDLFISVSPELDRLYQASGLPSARLWRIPNGVDMERFRPADGAERSRLKEALGLPVEQPLVLCVGFFSREKCPDILFEAWVRQQQAGGPVSTLLFIGATRSAYYEVDDRLAQEIREGARRLGLQDFVRFVEATHQIEQYYRSADVFVLPSSREGLPNALLEAMASGLACIATRLAGVTDALIEQSVNGVLVPVRDAGALAEALRFLLSHSQLRQELGRRARDTIEGSYSIASAGARYLAAYGALRERSSSSGHCASPSPLHAEGAVEDVAPVGVTAEGRVSGHEGDGRAACSAPPVKRCTPSSRRTAGVAWRR